MSNLEKLEALFISAQKGSESDIEELFEFIWNMVRGGLQSSEELNEIQNIIKWFQLNKAAINSDSGGFVLITLAFFDFFANKYESAVALLNEAMQIFRSHHNEDAIAATSTFLGVNYRALGVKDLALKYIIEAQSRLQKSGKFPSTYVACGFQQAELYTETGNYKEAIIIFEQSLEIAKKQNDLFFICRIYVGLGGSYIKIQNFELGLYNLGVALKLSDENNFHGVTAKILTDIGDYYKQQGEYELAIDYNRKAVVIREKENLRNAVITNIINIAELYHLQHKTDEAIQMLGDALSAAAELRVRSKVYHIQLLLSDLYEATGDLSKSLYYHRQYHTTKEHLSAEDNEKRVKNIKLVIEAEQTRKENAIIKAQKTEIEEKNAALEDTIDELTLARNIIVTEKKRSDDLLLNILPAEVAEELKNKGSAEAKQFSDVTVLFTDFIGFTTVTEKLTPQGLVDELHHCFKGFDAIMDKYGIEKIKTVGDAYLAVSGLPAADNKHAEHVVNAAMEIRQFMVQRKKESGNDTFEIRIGINSGSVVAGIVGVKKFAYDIWGDTVNIAARMEQNSEAGKINISQTTYGLVKDKFKCEYRGEIVAKNMGKMSMYFVL